MVKRWTCSCKDDFGYEMYAIPKADEYGGCVAYDDYAALEAENARLREAYAVMADLLRDMGQITEALKRRLDGA